MTRAVQYLGIILVVNVSFLFSPPPTPYELALGYHTHYRLNDHGGFKSNGDSRASIDAAIQPSLLFGPAHGYAIASTIAQRSDDVLQVEQGSLYPALQRIEERGWVSSYWGVSESNRRARFYKLTARGKRQLTTESSRWDALARAVGRVLRPV